MIIPYHNVSIFISHRFYTFLPLPWPQPCPVDASANTILALSKQRGVRIPLVLTHVLAFQNTINHISTGLMNTISYYWEKYK